MTKKKPIKMVMRFTKGERLSHWVHAISFFLLLFTGLTILLASAQSLIGFGGVQIARYVHRIVAVVFIVVVAALFFVGDTRYHWQWLKACFTWKKSDLQHIAAFPKEFFGGHGNYPAQGRFNGGEKINSLITIFGSITISISGLIMWFAHLFPAGLVRWMYPVHDLSMFLMTTAIVGHMYLALINPASRPAIRGITKGDVPESFVKAHYGAWYEQLKKEGKA